MTACSFIASGVLAACADPVAEPTYLQARELAVDHPRPALHRAKHSPAISAQSTLLFLATAFFFLANSSLGEAGVVSSRFDSDLDGWTVASVRPQLVWAASGGNPDGYARWNEPGVASVEALRAPIKFLGNWLPLDGVGNLAYDHKIIQAGGISGFIPYHVEIAGPGGAAVWQGPTPTGLTDWVTVTVPIRQADWNVTRGSWISLLSDVGTLDIRIELVGNSHYRSEYAGLDNVTLLMASSSVPEIDPACIGSVLALVMGGLALIERRRPKIA